jgi:hypothetical protein
MVGKVGLARCQVGTIALGPRSTAKQMTTFVTSDGWGWGWLEPAYVPGVGACCAEDELFGITAAADDDAYYQGLFEPQTATAFGYADHLQRSFPGCWLPVGHLVHDPDEAQRAFCIPGCAQKKLGLDAEVFYRPCIRRTLCHSGEVALVSWCSCCEEQQEEVFNGVEHLPGEQPAGRGDRVRRGIKFFSICALLNYC